MSNPLPQGWQLVKLGSIAEIVTGSTPSKNTQTYYGGDIPWIKPDDLDRSVYVDSSTEYLTETGAHESRLLPIGAVLVSCIGNIGKSAIAARQLATNQQINSLVPGEKITSEFLYYVIKFIRPRLEAMANLVVVPIINKSRFSEVEIPLPPLEEQHRIVEILREADDLRKLRRAANQRASDLLPALFYEMFGDPVTNPKGWKKEPLVNYIATSQYGLSTGMKETGEISVLRMNNLTLAGFFDFSELKYLDSNQVDFKMYDLLPGDILFNRTNSKELVGKTGIWEDREGLYTFASYLIRVRLKNGLLPEIVWALLNTPYGKSEVAKLAKQAVNMANINTKEMGSIPVIIPALDLQQKFVKTLEEIRHQINLTSQSAFKTEKLFESLLARAFSGELTAGWRKKHPGLQTSVVVDNTEPTIAQDITGLTPEKRKELLNTLAGVGENFLSKLTMPDISVSFAGTAFNPPSARIADLFPKFEPMSSFFPSVNISNIMKSIVDDTVSSILTKHTFNAAADSNWLENLGVKLSAVSNFAAIQSQLVPEGWTEFLKTLQLQAEAIKNRDYAKQHVRKNSLLELDDDQYIFFVDIVKLEGIFTLDIIFDLYSREDRVIDKDKTIRGKSRVWLRQQIQTFAAAGLIKEISLHNAQKKNFFTAYRNLRPEDNTQRDDLAALNTTPREAVAAGGEASE